MAHNQVPPRVDVDELGTHHALVAAVRAYGGGWSLQHLQAIGRTVGGADFVAAATRAHTHPPVLHTHDRYGERIDHVTYDPAYHRVLGAAVAAGAHSTGWTDPRPGAGVARAATFYLFAQVEPGHACPVSMTHAAVASLDGTDLAGAWLPRLTSTEYEPALRPGKTSALAGMSMTERQGGSDVRANTTAAVPAGDGTWRLTGEKWFCSAPMCDVFLVLAQAPGGLSCYLVPRVLPDGGANPFRLRRLKDKLGNRSNASAELELDGTVGHLVGEEGRGVRAIMGMVARTRLDCVLGTAAGMRQGVAEALWHARHRYAFGTRLADAPAMTAVLADLALESEAATAVGLRLARAYESGAGEAEQAFRRLATPVSKYWVCKRGPGHAYEALECLGGNGYVEDFPLARRYREQPVLAIWEGSGNVVALDVLRALRRDPEAWTAFEAETRRARGAHPLLDEHLDRCARLVAELDDPTSARAQSRARPLVEALALALQATVLVEVAPTAVAEAFVAARLGPDRGGLYGVLPAGTDTAAILDRHG